MSQRLQHNREALRASADAECSEKEPDIIASSAPAFGGAGSEV